MPTAIRSLTPLAPAHRIEPIDVVRGVALGGVLLVNLLDAFRIPLSAHILGADEPLGWAGAPILTALRKLIEFKAFTLFSILFGVGVGIQAGRSPKRERRWFLVRRFLVLLTIGVVHIVFVWNGDILTLYAVCGLALIPLLDLPEFVLIVLGLALIMWPNVAPFPLAFPSAMTLKALSAEALHAYRVGTWHELFCFRLRETRLLITPLLILSWPRTLGLMLWGLVLWRKRWMIDRGGLWRGTVLAGVAVGIAGYLLQIEEAANIGLAFAYGAALLLLSPHARWIAAGGQMALTNYLLQSIIFGLIFYSYGLGLFDHIGVVPALVGGLLVYCLELVMSGWWLKRFYFGPCEWLWRSASYLTWQPIVRNEHFDLSRASPGS